jgi:hypothetical protein
MNTLSRIVICLIVMMVPVTVKAGFDKIDEPLPAIGPEGADTLTQGRYFGVTRSLRFLLIREETPRTYQQ